MTTSADKAISVGLHPATQTNPVPCPVIEIDLYRSRDEDVPIGHFTIDEYIEQGEKDDSRRRALSEARQWVAETLYKGEEDSIRSLRLKKGLSQAKLASLANTTQAHIARIETGYSDCQVGTLQRVANALGIDVLDVVKAFLTPRQAAARTSRDE